MDNIIFYRNKYGNTNSVYPPQTFLTFEYWIYMVPQYKPKSVLMLGYADGTVAGLIKLIWGDVPITAVDIKPCSNRYGVNFIQADAQEFVKTAKEYDAVLIDLFDRESGEACSFVSDPDFVANVSRIGSYLVVNSLGADMAAYKDLREIGVNQASGSAVKIYYYETKGRIPNLHPHK